MPNLIKDPPPNWLANLRKGNRVWLVKEQEEATVEWPYEPPDPGHKCGQISIQHAENSEAYFSWFVNVDGTGIDGKALFAPIEGELPENPEPLPEPVIQRLQRAVEYLERRVRALEHQPALDQEAVGYCHPVDTDRMVFKMLYARYENDVPAVLKGYRTYLLGIKSDDLKANLVRASALAQIQHELQQPVRPGQVWLYARNGMHPVVNLVTEVNNNPAVTLGRVLTLGRTLGGQPPGEHTWSTILKHMLDGKDDADGIWTLLYDPE